MMEVGVGVHGLHTRRLLGYKMFYALATEFKIMAKVSY
jgi:hypothetical protein